MTLLSHLSLTPDWLFLIGWPLLSLTSLEANLGLKWEGSIVLSAGVSGLGGPYADTCMSGPRDLELRALGPLVSLFSAAG